VGQKLNGGGFTALLVGVAEGQKGRVLGEIPAHAAIVTKVDQIEISKTFNA
jgi:hypothetical protein